MNRQTKSAITICVIAILVLLILALYGYLTGAWDEKQEEARRPHAGNTSAEGHSVR